MRATRAVSRALALALAFLIGVTWPIDLASQEILARTAVTGRHPFAEPVQVRGAVTS